MARKKPLCAFLALCLSAADKRLTARSRKEKGGPPDVKKYTLKRILTSLFTLLAILLVLFILMQLMPGVLESSGCLLFQYPEHKTVY